MIRNGLTELSNFLGLSRVVTGDAFSVFDAKCDESFVSISAKR